VNRLLLEDHMNTFGHTLRVTTWGESHGPSLGVVMDGLPSGLAVDEALVQRVLDRRRPGQSRLTTPRQESDRVTIEAGVFEGRTTGAPLCMQVRNHDADSSKYENLRDTYRPSHADYTMEAKYGFRDWRGGARASARETVGRVAAGAVAMELLREFHGVEIVGWVDTVAHLRSSVDPGTVTLEDVERNDIRCPDEAAATDFIAHIDAVRRERDSVGGCISCVVRNVPAGWGEPVFDKLEAMLAHAMLSLPASKGFEVGSGFAGTLMRGSEHNDAFIMREGQVRTLTNRSGGIQGGISNGEMIVFRVAFKPVATVFQPQQTVDTAGNERWLEMKGRHDPCVLPRAVPMVETMAALVLADAALAQSVRTSYRRG
jgi:chorismate synthase